MKPSGFYKLAPEYIALVNKLNGTYQDHKDRPIYCCIQDKQNPSIYWAIPTSDLSHRSPTQAKRIKSFCELPERDIRSCYYHLGHTNKPAIFKISNALPVTKKYISGEYFSQGKHLVLKDKKLVNEISRKLHRILFAESQQENRFEQHITDIYNLLSSEEPSDETT